MSHTFLIEIVRNGYTSALITFQNSYRIILLSFITKALDIFFIYKTYINIQTTAYRNNNVTSQYIQSYFH